MSAAPCGFRMYAVGMDTTRSEQHLSGARAGVDGAPGLLVHALNRLFSRHAMNAALLILLAILLSNDLRYANSQLDDPDIWWHLADARILITTHHFIRVEPYSFSVAGERWTNPEWLGEMPFWFGYQSIGLAGIYLVTAIGVFANILFVYWRSYRRTSHMGAAFWASALAFPMMTVNSGPRTILFAYLAMSGELAILEAAERGKAHLLWLLPPLFCLWINLHGSWAIGMALLALYIVSGAFAIKAGVFEQEAHSRKDLARLIQVFAACLAALFANPYGWRLVWNPIDMLLNQKLNIAIVQEWQPLSLSSLAGMAAVAAIGLSIVANCVCGRKWKVYELAFLFFAWISAFNHARFTFLAAVITTPLLAGELARSFCARTSNKTIPAFNALFAAGMVYALVHFFPTNASLQRDLEAQYPLRSIASIQPSWRTFAPETLGGIMDLNGKPTFLDTRVDTFEHHGVLLDFLRINALRDSLRLLDKYRIDHALIPADSSLSYLLERIPGWRVAMREGNASGAYNLFVKSPSNGSEQPGCVASSAAAGR